MPPRRPPPSKGPRRPGRPPMRWSVYKAMVKKRTRGRRAKAKQAPVLRGPQIGHLVVLRRTIKVEALQLSRNRLKELLRFMEDLRVRRLGQEAGNSFPPGSVPDMIWPELYREVVWRAGTLPLEDAVDVVNFLQRMKRRRLKKFPPPLPPKVAAPKRFRIRAPLATIAELTGKNECISF